MNSNSSNTDVLLSSTLNGNYKLQNGWSTTTTTGSSNDTCSSNSPPLASPAPPPLPPRRLSTTLKQPQQQQQQTMTVNNSNVNGINLDNPVKLYTRHSQDEILLIRLPLCMNSTSPQYNHPHQHHHRVVIDEIMKQLGLHLVSQYNTEYNNMITLVANCQTDNDCGGGLKRGDEIVQVEDINVCGLDHVAIEQIIHSKITEFLSPSSASSSSSSLNKMTNHHHHVDGQSTQSLHKSFITLIVRRNPANLSTLMSILSSSPSMQNDTSKVPIVNSPLNENNFTSSTSSEALSSPSNNLLPTGSKPIPHTFLKQIMVELNEDFHKFQLFDIVLERGSDGFGIFIVNLSPNNEPGVFVTEIRPNSPASLSNILVHEVHSGGAAARDGRLQVGDRLLAVNGIDLREATQKDATKIIRSADDCIQLVVYRDPEPQYLNQGMFECHHVHLKRDMPGQCFGLTLIGRPHYSTGTAIGGITENSPAARSNLLEVGDIILEINGWDMRLAKSDEVINLLKNAHSDVKLLIGRYKTTAPSLHAYPRNRLHVYVVVLERRQLNLSAAAAADDHHGDQQQPNVENRSHSNESNNSLGNSLCDESVAHKNDQEINGNNNNADVNDDDDEIASAAFGLRIRQANTQELYDSHIQLIVDSIQHNSPADRLGMIMPGDRLLSIDREPVDWLNPNEIIQLLANLPYCTIELGRLPYYTTATPLSVNTRTLSSNKLPVKHSPSSSPSLSPPIDDTIQQDEYHELCPPYPPPSQEQLPSLFGGIMMPCIETPKFLRDIMFTLPEQQNENDHAIPMEHLDNLNEPNHHHHQSIGDDDDDDSNNEQHHNDQLDSMFNRISSPSSSPSSPSSSSLNEDEIKKALELAERSNGGFFVRQINLPIAPIHTNNNNNTDNNTNTKHSSIRLGLRLINGPGVSGPVVVRIEPNSCASQTNIHIGDRILGLDDKLLLSLQQQHPHSHQCSADDILEIIENVWLTRSMNSQPATTNTTYEENPCCLTIISHHNLSNDSTVQENHVHNEKDQYFNRDNHSQRNHTPITHSLEQLHLTNGNYTTTNNNCNGNHNNNSSSISISGNGDEMENSRNHTILLSDTTINTTPSLPLSYGSKLGIPNKLDQFQQQNGTSIEHSQINGEPNHQQQHSQSLNNHSDELLSLESNHDVMLSHAYNNKQLAYE
ncbi:unnamed protein product [Schistosoma turkestanicum]|nr:unnamed protein product [Schistosoma turkestanicum]